MAVIREFEGVSLSSNVIKPIALFEGISLSSNVIKPIALFEGISLSSNVNVKITFLELATNDPLIPSSVTYAFTNPSNIFLNGITSINTNIHNLVANENGTLSITASLTGYFTASESLIISNFNDEYELIVYFTPFDVGCTTKMYNSQGVEVQKILSNGYITTRFQGLQNTPENYKIYVECYIKGRNLDFVELLDYEVIESGVEFVTIKYLPKNGNYVYIPNITLE